MNPSILFQVKKKLYFVCSLRSHSSNFSETCLVILFSICHTQIPSSFFSSCIQSPLYLTFAYLNLPCKPHRLLYLSLYIVYVSLISTSINSTSSSSQFYAMRLNILSGFVYISFLSPNKFFDGSDLFISLHNPRNLVLSILSQIYIFINS